MNEAELSEQIAKIEKTAEAMLKFSHSQVRVNAKVLEEIVSIQKRLDALEAHVFGDES